MGFTVLRLIRRESFWRQLHLYTSLILSLQLIAWFASGLVMAIFPIDEVRGSHLKQELPTVNWQHVQYSPAQILANFPSHSQLSLSQRGSFPVYLVQHTEQVLPIDAITGKTLQPLTEDEVIALAKRQYRGDFKLEKISLLAEAPSEVRGISPPIWQIVLSTLEQTTLYLDTQTGLVQRVRTDTWRLYDFFWMLHIMDYQNRENFNHGLLIFSAASALLFSLSGLVLLAQVLQRKRRH